MDSGGCHCLITMTAPKVGHSACTLSAGGGHTYSLDLYGLLAVGTNAIAMVVDTVSEGPRTMPKDPMLDFHMFFVSAIFFFI